MTMNESDSILQAIEAGDPLIAEQLLPLLYDELRQLARVHLAREQPGQTLQPTALVNEAYLRLTAGKPATEWKSRGHFFGAAAIAIRRILIENARRKRSLKYGGAFVSLPLNEDQLSDRPQPIDDVLALDEALQKFTTVHAQAAELVQLRYFAGLTIAEAACSLDISVSTANRLWSYARAWLRREVEGNNGQTKP